MSFFKSFGTAKKTKSKDGDPKDKSKKKGQSYDPNEFTEEIQELPPFRDRRAARSLSISKSGRHKMNKKQRGSVLGDDMYSPETSPNGPNSSDPMKKANAPWGDNSQCKDKLNGSLGRTHVSGGAQPRPSQPTAV